jgi:hypothetical protein
MLLGLSLMLGRCGAQIRHDTEKAAKHGIELPEELAAGLPHVEVMCMAVEKHLEGEKTQRRKRGWGTGRR